MNSSRSFIPLQHQAAGHEGPLQSSDGLLFSKPTVQSEIDFYNSCQLEFMRDCNTLDKEVIGLGDRLYHWMPTYYGTLIPGDNTGVSTNAGPSGDDGKQYIVLKNSLYGFKKPCVLDIKLGSKLYDETADDEKIERMRKVSKETTSGSLSFRICGMKIVSDDEGVAGGLTTVDNIGDVAKFIDNTDGDGDEGYLTFNKHFGRFLNKDNVIHGLSVFFKKNKLSEVRQRIIIENFTKRLSLLYNCLLSEQVRIISGSLLFIFETDVERWVQKNDEDPVIIDEAIIEDDEDDDEDDADESSEEIPLSCLKFVDFAHAKYTPGKGYDEELVNGVDNLIRLFEQLLE